MADTLTAVLNSDGTATVTCVADITGASLPASDAANQTQYYLPAPQSTFDNDGNLIAAVAWTESTAISSIQAQWESDRNAWIVAQGGTVVSSS